MFDSLNVYDNLEVLSAKTPEELILLIKQIKRPIKILAFVSDNNRHFAYISGDIIIKRTKKNKE
jgi:hypothetical protein